MYVDVDDDDENEGDDDGKNNPHNHWYNQILTVTSENHSKSHLCLIKQSNLTLIYSNDIVQEV